MSETVLFDELRAVIFRPKLPIITWQFWAIKLLTTAMGEGGFRLWVALEPSGRHSTRNFRFRCQPGGSISPRSVQCLGILAGCRHGERVRDADISYAAGLSHSLGVLLFAVLLGAA
jgi:hypothetical protein